MTDTSHPFIDALEPLVARVNTAHTWTRSAETGEQRCRKTEELTRARLAQHLNGGPARGVCPIRKGESLTSVAVLDFDDHDKTLPWAAMSLAVGRVVDALEFAWGLSPVLWRSGGGRGVHLFLLWDTPQDAYSVRQWLTGVLAAVSLRPGTGGVSAGQVELFPKQDEVGATEKDWGSQFILPGSRASVPLVLEELSGLLEEKAGGVDGWTATDWPVESGGVPVVERPVRVAPAVPVDFSEGAAWRQALDALASVPAAVAALASRAPWLDCLMGIHHESQGSEDGRAAAHAWSARLPQYEPEQVDKAWDGFTLRADGVTGATILHHARKLAGWVEPIDASEFTSLVVQEPRKTAGDAGAAAVEGAPFELEGEPDFDREKGGVIKPTITNTVKAVEISRLAGLRVAWDEFRDEITVAAPGTNGWRPLADPDLVEIRMNLERLGFKSAGREQVRDAVVLCAERNRYDSAQLWLRGLAPQWDGVRRVDRFLIDCFGCADDAYTRAVSRYLWTALAGRVLDPGCQADMVPIFEGDQGLRKSSGVAALVPDPQFFVEVDLAESEDAIVRKSRGTLVGEIAELQGLRTRALEWVKKFVVRRTEKWVPKFKEFSTTFKRRAIYIGTTNRDDVLADSTGERRWLPVHITRVDVEMVVAMRDQLWAEGARMWAGELAAESPGVDRGLDADGSPVVWTGGGVAWHDAERLAVLHDVHAGFSVQDEWEVPISRWLAGAAADDLGEGDEANRAGKRRDWPFALSDLMHGALGVAPAGQDMNAQRRAGEVLRRAGFVNRATRTATGVRKMWRAGRET